MKGLNLYTPRGRAHSRGSHLLRRLGPSWAASPIRRLIQSLCFVAFMVGLFYVCWPYGAQDLGNDFAAKERIDAEIFLTLDPLVSLSTAIAARQWVGSLCGAGLILVICLFIPRGFCGYVCPLGTLLDVFDWTLGRRAPAHRLTRLGWWVNLKYLVLGTVLLAAIFGVLLSGFVAAIPVFTRAMVFMFNPVQTGLFKGWYQVPDMHTGHTMSIGLFAGILALSLVEKRFWCKYLCPTGAVFSIANLLRLNERKVATSCIKCGQCDKACDFAAIQDNYATRHADCSFCQTCGGACPVEAISFAGRHARAGDVISGPAARGALQSRRLMLTQMGCTAALGAGVPLVTNQANDQEAIVRAPGSVPEAAFLQLCVRCGLCIKVCPNNVLHPMGFEQGFNRVWTPQVVADWSGCEPTCNNCGQVCPTGAIRALDIEEKRAARMALAVVDQGRCLPYAGSGECRLCMDECKAAGYNAIEFMRVGGEVDLAGEPVPGSGFLAPVVLAEKCVGCGLCQMRCRGINVKEKHVLDRSAICLVAGGDHEDRIFSGSYVKLQRTRQSADHERAVEQNQGDDYLPDFLQ